MSAVVSDSLQKVVQKISKGKQPDWNAYELVGEPWERVSKIIVSELDEMKGHGVGRPLAALQEWAMKEALKADADKSDKLLMALHTTALWLTSARILAEQYAEKKDNHTRKVMERLGLLKKRKAD